MEHKQSSSQGRPQRPVDRRRRRRRRGSPATSPGPAPVADRGPAAHGDAPPAAGEAHQRRPRHAAASRAPREAAPGYSAPAPAPAPVAAAAEPASDALVCPLCAEPVRDLYTAIAYGERRDPAHFDCIVALLGEREELEEGARLCYLGGGSFGIVQMRPASREGDRGGALLIRKRIEVEEQAAAPEWRRGLRLPLGSGT